MKGKVMNEAKKIERETEVAPYVPPEPDGYDDAVEYLTAHPEEIHIAWAAHSNYPAGALFRFASRSGGGERVERGVCGCLTMIRGGGGRWIAATPELDLAIRQDERIPMDGAEITPDHLPIFAGWQRRIDRELGRTPPPRMNREAACMTGIHGEGLAEMSNDGG